MKVRTVATTALVRAGPDDLLLQAAATMAEYEVGCLPVFHGDDMIGIFTERDLVRAIAEDADVSAATVAEYMSLEPVTVEMDADLHVAARQMLDAGVRHLPVVEADTVVGMVSVRDVLVMEAVS
jgi:CBS domain-containing protein